MQTKNHLFSEFSKVLGGKSKMEVRASMEHVKLLQIHNVFRVLFDAASTD